MPGVNVDQEKLPADDLRGVPRADLSQLDPKAYEDADSITFNVKIDILSRHLKSIEFGGNTTGRVETYSNYGQRRNVGLPDQAISIDELQGRLQTVSE